MKTLEIRQLSGRHLRQVSATLEPGLHVLLALDPVGTDELIPLLDGSCAARRGSVLLGGRCPYHTPEVRSHIGSLWAVESLPDAKSVRDSLAGLRLAPNTLDRTFAMLEQLGQGGMLGRAPRSLGPQETRTAALAVALCKSEPWAWLLFEPLLACSTRAAGIVARTLTQQAATIPVMVVTSSRTTAAQLGGHHAELGGGFWRRVQLGQPQSCTMRVAGASLRSLAAEIVRRPHVRALRLTTHAEGHDELWLETNDPKGVSLDLVRVAQQLSVRLWLVDTLTGLA